MAAATDLVIVGAGGFGREVRDVVESDSARYRLIGFVDDGDGAATGPDLTYPLLGGTDALEALPLSVQFLIAIGTGPIRRRLDERLRANGREAAVVVHEQATVGRRVELAPGAVICAGARLTTDIRVGRHLHVNLNATIGHDAVLGDYVTLNPNCSVSGNTTLGDEVNMGTGSTVIQGRSIGARSTVGAGGAVVRDLPADVVAVGIPAKPLGR